MTNRDLIDALLDYPMDMEVTIGLPRDNGEGMNIWAINTADILEIKLDQMDEEEPLIVLFHEEVIDHTLN